MPHEDSSRGVVPPNHGHCYVASWTLQSPPGDDLKVRDVAPNQVLRKLAYRILSHECRVMHQAYQTAAV